LINGTDFPNGIAPFALNFMACERCHTMDH
jgi:hypothetical protein